MKNNSDLNISFGRALFPVLVLVLLLLYGLILRPNLFGQKELPVELIFILGTIIAVIQQLLLSIKWKSIFSSIQEKIGKAMPTLLILLVIGMLIGSWIVCGTIPMLVYYGIKSIQPEYIYLLSFLIPVIFSTITGTSWGSIGTIGAVMMGIASSMDADLGITAAAVVGGSFFGDKMSPLSDTTNIAAAAVNINVNEHIKSMFHTTVPAALIAIIFFFVLGFIYVPDVTGVDTGVVQTTLSEIEKIFSFNILLLLPPVFVLYGSIKKKATIPVLVMSSGIAFVLALFFQDFSINHVADSILTGFDTNMQSKIVPSENVSNLFNRGGLYSLVQPVIVTILIFIYVGTIARIDAMSIIVNHAFSFIKSRGGLIRATLISTGITSSITTSQYATSFIVADAFKSKYDKMKVERNILSRSLEDMGTMLENIVPWHPTAIYIVATLGVPVADYWYWQVFSLSNFVIAFLIASFGFVIFKKNGKRDK